MVLNPAGLQMVADGGVPRIITGTARIAISGGQLVYISGASAAVSSGANSFVSSDITFTTGASGTLFNGIALKQVASGTSNYLPVATRGTFIITSAGTIVAGQPVYANGDDAVVSNTSVLTGSYAPIGRALTGAGSEGYVLVDIHG